MTRIDYYIAEMGKSAIFHLKSSQVIFQKFQVKSSQVVSEKSSSQVKIQVKSSQNLN